MRHSAIPFSFFTSMQPAIIKGCIKLTMWKTNELRIHAGLLAIIGLHKYILSDVILYCFGIPESKPMVDGMAWDHEDGGSTPPSPTSLPRGDGLRMPRENSRGCGRTSPGQGKSFPRGMGDGGYRGPWHPD